MVTGLVPLAEPDSVGLPLNAHAPPLGVPAEVISTSVGGPPENTSQDVPSRAAEVIGVPQVLSE